MKDMTDRNPAQKEGVQHGAYLFPFQQYDTILDQLHPDVPAHWHEEAEFTLIEKGSCCYYMNLKEYKVKEGDLLFIPPLTLHSAIPDNISGKQQSVFMESDTFVFHLNLLGINTTDICSIRYLVPIQNQELIMPVVIGPAHIAYEEALAVFNELQEVQEKKTLGYELLVKSLLYRLLVLLLQHQPEGTLSAPDLPEGIETIRTVLSYIEEHYPEPITIEQLSQLCHFSKYHFMRFFKHHIGMTCVEYINHYRLEKAVELLEQGTSSILEISLSVGYRNLSYFHRAFLKKYGPFFRQNTSFS